MIWAPPRPRLLLLPSLGIRMNFRRTQTRRPRRSGWLPPTLFVAVLYSLPLFFIYLFVFHSFFLPSMISSISWFHFLSSLSTLITCSFFLFTSLATAPEFAKSIFKRCDAVSWGAGNLEPSALKSSFLVLIVLRPRPSLVRRCDRRTRRRHHYLEQTVIHSFN